MRFVQTTDLKGMHCLGAMISFVLVAMGPSNAFAALAGKAVQVTGEVLIRNEDAKNSKMRLLKVGDSVEPGTVINTGSASSAKILLEDRSIIDLSPSTMFKINEYAAQSGDANRKVAMSLGFGKVRASVNTPVGPKGKFTIRTRSVTMGVRGTEFVVASDIQSADKKLNSGKTELTVMHGKVEVHDDRTGVALSEPLTAGKQLTAVIPERDPEQPAARNLAAQASVVELPPVQIEEVRREAKREYSAFYNAVVLDRSGERSSGSETLAAISQGFELPQGYVPSVGEIGFPGTFGSDFGLGTNVNQLVGLPVRVKVVFTQ